MSQEMNLLDQHAPVWLRLTIVWSATTLGAIAERMGKVQLAELVLLASLVYTVLLIITLIRDKWVKRKKHDPDE